MTRKVIIITAVGLVSFSGAFVFAWLTSPSPAQPPHKSEAPTFVDSHSERETGVIGTTHTVSSPMTRAMTEQQLKNLILDIREKMKEYDNRLTGLGVREKRLQVAQNVLREDIENLNNLRIELASTIAQFKSERDKLLRSRLEIDQVEKINLVSIAATYDKMEASSASKILTNMCGVGRAEPPHTNEPGSAPSGFDDAVMILHYMTERTKAKLLAELAASEPALAAGLCNRLKQIVERE